MCGNKSVFLLQNTATGEKTRYVKLGKKSGAKECTNPNFDNFSNKTVFLKFFMQSMVNI